jgi:hypothetical protein
MAQQSHWSECGRAMSIGNLGARGRPHRSVLSLGGMKTGEFPPREWFKYKTSLGDAEAAMRDEAKKLGVHISTAWLPKWEEFKAQLQPTDELWYYEYFPEALTGAAGYCIVRGARSLHRSRP